MGHPTATPSETSPGKSSTLCGPTEKGLHSHSPPASELVHSGTHEPPLREVGKGVGSLTK